MKQMNWGILVLRLAAGTLVMVHQVPVLMAGTAAWDAIGHLFSSWGMTQYGVQIGFSVLFLEVLAAILLILGVLARVSSGILALASAFEVWMRLQSGAGISGSGELVLLIAVGVCLVLTGPGQYRLFVR